MIARPDCQGPWSLKGSEQGSVSLVQSGSYRQTGQKVTPSHPPPKKGVINQASLVQLFYFHCAPILGALQFTRKEVGGGRVSLYVHQSLT